MSGPVLDLSVYLVADVAQCRRAGVSVADVTGEAVAGGATTVQLRAKDLPAGEFADLAVTVAARIPDRVPFIINDRIDVFLALRARGVAVDGVHVGQRDLDVSDVRRLIGDDAIVGLSTATRDEVAAAAGSTAVDYLGIGAVRETRSKADAPSGRGVDGVSLLARAASHPAVAIGGVVAEDLPDLRAGGLAGAAVVSWICCATDPRAAAAQLRRAWDSGA